MRVCRTDAAFRFATSFLLDLFRLVSVHYLGLTAMLRFVDSFSKYQNKQNHRSSRRPSNLNLSYQNLETRCLLAGISFDATTGVLLIEGDVSEDVSEVQLAQSGTMVQVSLTGFADETYPVADVVSLRFEGGLGNDQFSNFTSIPSEVLGGGGNDTILSGSGNDMVIGGAGNDTINGGGGDDFLAGNSGVDTITGASGNDEILGGSGGDELRGGIGDDMIFGQEGTDTLSGGDGVDEISGGNGVDEIFGGEGNDRLQGGLGNDRILGGVGNDTIFGDEGNDELVGGSGEDTIQGGDGIDELFGGTENDNLSGGEGDDLLSGQTGDDTIDGQGGDDLVLGQSGNDNLSGGDGNDRIFGNNGDDIINGGLGNDRVFGSLGIDSIRGGEGDDLIYGGSGNDTIFGDLGNDTLIGNAGDDQLDAGLGNDIVFGDLGNDEIRGGDGEDELFGQAGDDLIFGANDNDLILGGDGNDTVFGGFGDDLIFGSGGNDNLYGQVGADTVLGQAGNDGNFGGVGGGDTVIDREGRNRFLDFGNDEIAGVTPTDARIVFRNGTDSWTNREIETLDRGFQMLIEATGSPRVLQSTTTSSPLVFVKNTTVFPSGEIATSALVSSEVPVFNSETLAFEFATVTERTLTFGDWDESDQMLNDFYVSQLPGLIAIDWAGPDAIGGVIPSQASLWNSFLVQSGWTQNRPEPIQFFEVSGDSQWFYRSNALFVGPDSTENPTADFSDIWNLFFETGATAQAEQARLASKISIVDQLFTSLSFF